MKVKTCDYLVIKEVDYRGIIMILIIDNYDSFTFNLVQAFGEFTTEMNVFKNDEITINEIKNKNPSHIVISPGPGLPEKAGISLKVIEAFCENIPILGVCLGHQAIVMAFGGRLQKAQELFHGRTSEILHDEKGIFKDVQNPFKAMRYHSWIIDENDLSKNIHITARTKDQVPMALRHTSYPLSGVQFHPESILTFEGKKILKNFYENPCH